MARLKGISPMVSTVLLIAVAVSVGMIVTNWMLGWTEDQTGSDNACVTGTYYIIEKAEWNKSADLNSTLRLKITNKGEYKIYGFSVEIDNGTSIMLFDTNEVGQGGISASNRLEREHSAYIIVNLTNTTLGYPAFGRSLLTSDEAEVRVTNDACDGVSAKTSTIR